LKSELITLSDKGYTVIIACIQRIREIPLKTTRILSKKLETIKKD
jgi:hypothetical protein